MPLRTTCIALILLVFVYVLQVAAATRSRSYHPAAFTIMSAKANRNRGEIYNIPGSGWKSPAWNWGSAQGTGHDCAMICRKRWGTADNRKLLLDNLSNPAPLPVTGTGTCTVEEVDDVREPKFEEVKLILGLAFQNGRWDGSDGGAGGYGDVLATLASAERYESDNGDLNAELFVKDMKERFHLVASSEEAMEEMMNSLDSTCGNDVDRMRRKCSALVLSQMGFIENGL